VGAQPGLLDQFSFAQIDDFTGKNLFPPLARPKGVSPGCESATPSPRPHHRPGRYKPVPGGLHRLDFNAQSHTTNSLWGPPHAFSQIGVRTIHCPYCRAVYAQGHRLAVTCPLRAPAKNRSFAMGPCSRGLAPAHGREHREAVLFLTYSKKIATGQPDCPRAARIDACFKPGTSSLRTDEVPILGNAASGPPAAPPCELCLLQTSHCPIIGINSSLPAVQSPPPFFFFLLLQVLPRQPSNYG